MKYIRNFSDVSTALAAGDLLSPHLSFAKAESKIMHIDCGQDKQVEIKIDPSTGEPKAEEKQEEPAMDYLTFTAQEAGSTIKMTHSGTNKTSTKPHIDYQINDGAWVTKWNGDTTITLQNVGDYVKMKGHNESGFSRSNYNYSVYLL